MTVVRMNLDDDVIGHDRQASLDSIDDLDDPNSPQAQLFRQCSFIYEAVRMKRSLSIPVSRCTLEWRHVGVSYQTPYGPVATLRDCSGVLRGGELLALMGPSGAGKSTLLDTLTMRKTTGYMTGEVLLNSEPRDHTFLLASTFVPQEDNFIPTNTVRETMDFYASLTMPMGTPRTTRSQAVEERLQSVGLAEKQFQRVGGRLPGGFSLRGLSGGERRRLSIAAGVVHSPPMIFLDEPTSGLDAFSALCVMESLRSMANQGHAVACSIHQPRAAILAMFSKVAFLAAGRLVYLGAPDDISDWLDSVGLWDPGRSRAASLTDYVLDCITTGFDKPVEQYGTKTVRDESGIETLAAEQRKAIQQELDSPGSGIFGSDERLKVGSRPGPVRQYFILQRQQLRLALRSPATLASRMGLHLLLGLLIGAVFYDMDSSFLEEGTGLKARLPPALRPTSTMPQDRIGVLFLLALTLQLTPMAAISFFIEDRQYYGREATAGLYGALPYHVANMITEAIVCTANASLEVWVVTLLVGMPLSGRRSTLLLCLVSHHACASALAQLCGRLAPNQDVAVVLTAAYITTCLLFANVLVKVNVIMPFVRDVRWGCELYYAMSALVEIEFADVHEFDVPAGDAVAASFAVDSGGGSWGWQWCLLAIWIFYCVSAIGSFLALKYLHKPKV